jgi:hypothetical protein
MRHALKDWRLWAAIGCLGVMWDPFLIRYAAFGAAMQLLSMWLTRIDRRRKRASSARDPVLLENQVHKL